MIKRFLPPQARRGGLRRGGRREVIAELGACKLKDTGRVITELKNRYSGRMDFARRAASSASSSARPPHPSTRPQAIDAARPLDRKRRPGQLNQAADSAASASSATSAA